MFGSYDFLKKVSFVVAIVFAAPVVMAAKSATVQTDGAIVYRKADFDSPVLGYFRRGQKVKISSKKFGPFYRVRFKQGVIGYITDVDVGETGASKVSEKEAPAKKKAFEPLVLRTLLGVAGGYSQYAEIIAKREYKGSSGVVGAKFTTPMAWLQGPFIFDLEVVTSLSVPEYYKEISPSGAKGYFVRGLMNVNYALEEFAGRRGLMYIGAGPAVTYSSFLVEVAGSKLDLSEARMGADICLGMAFESSGFVFKIEPKYIVEKTSYYSIDMGLQFTL